MRSYTVDTMTHTRFFVCLLLCLTTLTASAQIVYPGAYSSHSVQKNVVTVQVGESRIVFSFYRPSVVRVDFLPTASSRPDSSYAVVQRADSSVSVSVANTDQALTMTTRSLSIVCSKNPFRVRYADSTGRTILADAQQGGLGYYPASIDGAPHEQRFVNFTLQSGEHLYGTGERSIGLDLRGQRLSFQNQPAGFYNAPMPNMNTTVPFFASSAGYGLFIDNTYWNDALIGIDGSTDFRYQVTGGELTYYVMASPTIAGQLEAYTWLTGRQPIPPRWSLGYIQSKFGYRSETEARSVVSRMRQENIPCDAIVLDLYWFNAMGDVAWYKPNWPDPAGMCRDFLTQGIKTIAITEPHIVTRSINYIDAFQGGYFARNGAGAYGIPNWFSCSFQAQSTGGTACTASLLDFSNPRTGPWWWAKQQDAFAQGLAGIWTDLGEPEGTPPSSRTFTVGYQKGPENQISNVENLLWMQSVATGFAQLRPDQRLFNLTRSGWAGQQRYGPVTWSGDVYKTFTGLQIQLPMLLNMGMSGMGYHHSDVSGFYDPDPTNAKPELYARWMQFGAFSPIMRAHSFNTPAEPWADNNASVKAIARQYIQLRYRLLPYRYALAHENNRTGMPIARPLFFAYPSDEKLYGQSSAYLFGPSLLVAPVTTAGQTTQTVYLPADDWVNYWTDALLTGGTTVTVEAPLDRLPLFVRAGSQIPMQPLMNYADERKVDTLTIQTYPSLKPNVRTSFTLYDDDGQTLAYQRGQVATTTLSQQVSTQNGRQTLELTTSASTGSYTGKLSRRTYLSVVHLLTKKPASLTRNSLSMVERGSLTDLRQQTEGYYYDPATALLYVQLSAHADSNYTVSITDVSLATPTIITAVSEPLEPETLTVFPNPVAPSTQIRYQLANPTQVQLSLLDGSGRVVAVLAKERQQSGVHQYALSAGQLPGPGLYLIRLQTDAGQQTIRVVRKE